MREARSETDDQRPNKPEKISEGKKKDEDNHKRNGAPIEERFDEHW